jgi:RNA polymerase sigma factor (sigma-70 family)
MERFSDATSLESEPVVDRHRGRHVQRDLVIRAQGGDRDAFSELAAGAIARMYDLAQLMLRDTELAQDAVQEALVAAWRDLRGLRDPDRFDGWLHRVLVHAVYREAGRQRRRRASTFDVLAAASLAVPTSSTIEDRDELDRCFIRLSPEHRLALVHRHYLGLTDEQSAALLNIPVGTVKSRLHRATDQLRAELEAEARRIPVVREEVAR